MLSAASLRKGRGLMNRTVSIPQQREREPAAGRSLLSTIMNRKQSADTIHDEPKPLLASPQSVPVSQFCGQTATSDFALRAAAQDAIPVPQNAILRNRLDPNFRFTRACDSSTISKKASEAELGPKEFRSVAEEAREDPFTPVKPGHAQSVSEPRDDGYAQAFLSLSTVVRSQVQFGVQALERI